MKRFMQYVAAIKTVTAFAFTGAIMLLTVAAMFLGKDAISIGIIWQTVFLALIFGTAQFVCFSENIFTKLRTPGRLTILSVVTLAALSIFAAVFKWFDIGNAINWLVFAGVYAVIFLIATTALRMVFRVGELRYNELLVAYKSRQTDN
ncbi:hypothetical protein LJC63_02945 [Ruminococcaceae bacterium OttesenSCG-928-L11]|nr:hypothetical protein [Ruminococcaceae bacterium OttesenSCG-928-L11]